MTTQDSWIDDMHMEPYTPPESQSSSSAQSSSSVLQVPAGIVWTNNNNNNNQESLNLATCVDPNTPETRLTRRAVQKTESSSSSLQVLKDDSLLLNNNDCQIHLGTLHLNCASIQVVDDDSAEFDLILGSDFLQQHDIEIDLPNHQLVVPRQGDVVTVPFIQPRVIADTEE